MEPNNIVNQPKLSKKAWTIILVVLGLFAIGGVALFISNRQSSVNSYEDCVEQSPTSVKDNGNQSECTYRGKVFTKDKSTDNTITKYEDEALSFNHPKNWNVQKNSSITDNEGIHSISISSPYMEGVLISASVPVEFKSFITIELSKEKSQDTKGLCLSCKALYAEQFKFNNPQGPHWLVLSSVNNFVINMTYSTAEVKVGQTNHTAYIATEDGRILTIRGGVIRKYEDKDGKVTPAPIVKLEDIKNSSSYLTSLNIFKSLQVKKAN